MAVRKAGKEYTKRNGNQRKDRRSKSFQELEFQDSFMFAAVMENETLCREILERILGFSIEKVVVRAEQSLFVNPEYHGIRMDVYARDEAGTVYDVEMQTWGSAEDAELSRRSRYYQSQMDMALLLPGHSYRELPDSYVIFICTFDPFGDGLYRYIFQEQCRENGKLLGDGSCKIFLNTEGKNDGQTSVELLSFLRYVKKGAVMRREEATELKDDPLLNRLEKRLWEIKQNRGLEERYMLFEELLEKERREGREEERDTLLALITAMNCDGKGSEVCRLNEPEFLTEMLKKYGIQ